MTAKWTGREVGFLAWVLGILVGLVCVQVGGKRKTFALQVIAIVTAALGVLVGKYLAYAFLVRGGTALEFGASPPVLSAEMFQIGRASCRERV